MQAHVDVTRWCLRTDMGRAGDFVTVTEHGAEALTIDMASRDFIRWLHERVERPAWFFTGSPYGQKILDAFREFESEARDASAR